MKQVLRAMRPFLTEITHDFMMAACVAGPILMGAAFRFLIPVLERLLCGRFGAVQMLAPYYIIFDLLLAIMTPLLFCFAGVLVILEELDCGVAKYYAVTPIGKRGYLLSRIGIPALIALVYNAALLCIFSILNIDFAMIILLSVSGGLTAVLISLLVVSFAKNKMEGMALVKLCGLLLIGIPVAYFVASPVRYLFGVFPSFWMAELCITQNYLYFLPAVFSSCLMIRDLYGRFKKRLL
ncbi:MAG: ABC transporter permease [Oscillospiraceae bacterium]